MYTVFHNKFAPTGSPQKGMTLIELMLTIVIGSALAVIIVAVTTRGFANIRATKRAERLHANAAYATDVFSYWTKHAVLATTSPTTLNVTLPDGTQKTLARTGTNVTLNGVAVTSGDIEVTGLTFVKLEHSVRMALALRAKNSTETFSATTTSALRD